MSPHHYGVLQTRILPYNKKMTVSAAIPAAAGFYMPAEWEPHDACWLAWPCRRSAWGDAAQMEAARDAFVDIIRAIAEFEPVWVVAPQPDAAAANKRLGGAAKVLAWPIDDSWMRDSGPTFLVNAQGQRAGVDWQFNAWGNKYAPFDADNAVAAKILAHLQIPRFAAPLIMEGGSFHTDGAATLLLTEQCLLNPNRNPHLSRADIESRLRDYLGVRTFIWLAGDRRDDETDGHIDNIACFAAPATVLAMHDPNDKTLAENIRRLQKAKDDSGRHLNLVFLPRPQVREKGRDLLASYINFYFANGGIIMPSFGVKEDDAAQAIMSELFPSRRVVPVRATAIVRGGGGIHCITQQLPAAKTTARG